MTDAAREDVYQKLQVIFRQEFDEPNIVLTPEMTSADVKGWDSAAQINLILACEEAFGIRLKSREINSMENISEMVDHLLKAMNKR
jgi:acyl carrier protein